MFGKIHLKGALIGAGTAVLLGIAPVAAAEMDDLKEQIEALKDRLSKLEKGGTSVSISGYVKGDFYIDNRDDRGGTFYAPTIPLKGVTDPEDDDGSFGAHAGQSRFRLGTSTPTSFGALNTLVEGGFNPYDTSHKFRLRQAYGELGPVLAGQAWSILGDDHTYADTIDFDGPVGVIGIVRKPQLRLTLPMGEGLYGQMAVEPAIRGNELPTFLAALRYSAGWGAVNVTGAVGRYDDGGQNVSAHAIHVGAHVNVAAATRLMATFNMSEGVDLANGPDGGRIWGGGSGALPDASDDLKAMETMGGIAGLSHGWSDSVRSGVYFGWVRNDLPNGVSAPDENESVQTLHANVIWSPVSQADIGLEVIHGWRETHPKADPAAETKGEATRVQIGVTYSF